MKGEKKKKSVEKCKGADVKAIPENSIYIYIWQSGLLRLMKFIVCKLMMKNNYELTPLYRDRCDA